MRARRTTHLARSFVVLLSALLVLAGAGFAAARTLGGPAWTQPLLSSRSSCDDTTGGATEGATEESADDSTTDDSGDTGDESSDAPSPEPTETTVPSMTGCTATDETDQRDETKTAADTQTDFAAFTNDCGSALLGDAKLTDAGTDPAVVDAYGNLADSLDSGQVGRMVQSVRVLLKNCETHANDGLENALYHHGVNWLRHYDHELWLEQKFADKWPVGKPGGGPSSDATLGKPDKAETHGNPHDDDASWAPGGGRSTSHGNGGSNAGGNGNAFDHS